MVTPRYFPFMGGVENHIYEVTRRLVRAGLDITVLTADPSRRLPSTERAEGVTIRRVHAWPSERDYFFAPDMYQIIKQGQWDLIHVQSYHTLVAPLAMFAALQAGIPYVVTFHGGGHSSSLRNAARGAQRALLRPLLARAERLVAIAEFEIDFYGKALRLPPEKFAYIPNGAEISFTGQPAAATTIGPLIASIGRLERYKGHHRMIEAMPLMLAQQPDARLWIAGSGTYEPELRRLANKLGVADRVDIRAIPAGDRQTMAAELSKVALVTLLSDYETHPVAALEALSLARPVLVTDTSGLGELARRGLARAVPLKSTTAQVASAVIEQLRHPLIPTLTDLPTWDACAEQLHGLYLGLYQNSRVRCVS
jgi:glycosyltransferase involved in cell wall biosynthesis